LTLQLRYLLGSNSIRCLTIELVGVGHWTVDDGPQTTDQCPMSNVQATMTNDAAIPDLRPPTSHLPTKKGPGWPCEGANRVLSDGSRNPTLSRTTGSVAVSTGQKRGPPCALGYAPW
jgi:hypothetical protein